MSEFIESIIDWKKFDATTNISQRLNGVTKEHLELEVDIWNKQLQMLESFDYIKVKEEIMNWDISAPANIAYAPPEKIGIIMSRLISYKTRLSYLMSITKTWREICESAIKYIEDLAPAAFTGTGPDKKANASHIVQPFIHLKSQVSGIDNFLYQIHNSVIFCAQQLDLMIKERQSRSKLNYKLGHIGEELFSSIEENQNEITIEEDGEIFQNVTKR